MIETNHGYIGIQILILTKEITRSMNLIEFIHADIVIGELINVKCILN